MNPWLDLAAPFAHPAGRALVLALVVGVSIALARHAEPGPLPQRRPRIDDERGC